MTPTTHYNVVNAHPRFLRNIKNFSLYNPTTAPNRQWIAVVDTNGTIVGILSYLGPEWADGKFITLGIVETTIKNKGISKMLLKQLFSLGYEVRNGYYKPDGDKYLKHQVDNHNITIKHK